MNGKLVAAVMSFYRTILKMHCANHVSNEENVRKAETKRILRNMYFKLIGHIIKKEGKLDRNKFRPF